MSNIKYPIYLPTNVIVENKEQVFYVVGPLGKLHQVLPKNVFLLIKGNKIYFNYSKTSRNSVNVIGTIRSLVCNMITGVSKGFERKLILVGVGYKAFIQKNLLKMQIGFSHEVEYKYPNDIKIDCISNTEIIIKGVNKQLVGQVAADIRAYRKPEPYKGKGIRYDDEKIVLKETKKKK